MRLGQICKTLDTVLKTEKLKDPNRSNIGAYGKAMAEDAGAMIKIAILQDFHDVINNKSGKGKPWDDFTVSLGVHKDNLIITGKDKNGQEETLVVKKGYGTLKAKKAVVINAQPKDDTINKSSDTMAKAKGLEKANTLGNADLSDIKGDLIILAHGGSSPLPGKVYCNNFGGKSATDVIKYLVQTRPLPKDYEGVVYLDGCFKAAVASKGTVFGDLNNFAGKVYKGLNAAGYKHLRFKGNLGAASTLDDGTESVVDAQSEAALKKNKAKLKPFEDKLKAAELAMVQSINKIENKYGHAMAKLKKVSDTGTDEEKEAAEENTKKLEEAKKKEIGETKNSLNKVQKTVIAAYKKLDIVDPAIIDLVETFGPSSLK